MKPPICRLLPIICVLFLASLLTSSAQQVREWNTTDGKKHKGSIMFMSSKSITLKGSRGMVSIPFSKLSLEDQKYITALKSNTKTVKNPGIPNPGIPLGKVTPAMSKTNALPTPKTTIPTKSATAIKVEWPNEVRTGFSPADIKTVSETKREGYIYRSPHFEFHSPHRLPHRAVREFSLVFESTFDLANAIPIGLNPKPGGNGYYITKLYQSYDDYFDAGGPAGSAGAFFPSTGEIHVPLDSLGVKRSQNNIVVNRGAAANTLVHEVTHQVMRRWLPFIPMWMGEGFAEITSALPYESGRFRLNSMTTSVRKSTGRGPGAGRSFEMVPLIQLMRLTPQTWGTSVAEGTGQQNYRSACVLTYYFLRLDGDGKGRRLNAYINARLKGVLNSGAEEKYLLDGRTYEELQKEVTRSWREEGLKITFSR